MKDAGPAEPGNSRPPDEQVFHLAPLPTTGGAQTPEELLAVPSIALFVDADYDLGAVDTKTGQEERIGYPAAGVGRHRAH